MKTTWKVLVYMAADETLYPYAKADLEQISQASSAELHVFVQLDGPRPEQASRYVCSSGNKRLIWEAPEDYTDDRGRRLKDFLEWTSGAEAAVARDEDAKLFLILWGHGAGLDRVYVYGDPRGKSPLQLPGSPANGTPQDCPGHVKELLNGQNANRYLKDITLGRELRAFSAAIGRKIDLLGFDACLMGMAEVCYELHDAVSIVVASDDTIPDASWPYDLILGDLKRHTGMDARTLSTIAVSRFQERYAMEQHQSDIELSSIDLEESRIFADAIRELAAALSEATEDCAQRGRILRARDLAQNPSEPAFIDIQAFCKELANGFDRSSSVHASANLVLRIISLEPYVIYHRDSDAEGEARSCGLSIYFPENIVPGTFDLQKAARDFALILHSPLHAGVSTGQMESLPSLRKSPPHSGKFPPHSGKEGITITANEILWDHYVALEFSKHTGWANFVKHFWTTSSRPKKSLQASSSGQS